MDGECARAKLNDVACRTFVDRVLDVGEVVPSATERIDRGANRRPVRDAADRKQAGIFPVRVGVVIDGSTPLVGSDCACAEPRKART